MRRSSIAPAAVSVLAAVVLFWETWRDLAATGWGDYQEYHHLWEAGRIAIERFGEWPLWDPFQCGGITQYGNPQTQVFHPLFYASLVVGTTIALKLFLTLHAAAGILGTYVYVRHDAGRGLAASWMAALTWAGSGYFAWHCGTGHGDFIAFYLTPWILVGWRRSLIDVRWAVLVGGVMSATVFAGGVYAFPFFVLLLAHQAAWALADPRRRRAVIPAGALAVLVTVLVGAFRLVPILADLEHHPRLTLAADSMTPAELIDSLTWRTTEIHPSAHQGHIWGWPEYGLYLGFVVLALALIGAVFVARRRGERWMLSGVVVFALLTMGDLGEWAPWRWIHELPIYDSLKVPSRFGVFFELFLVLLAARGLDAVAHRVTTHRPRLARVFVAAVALLAVGDVGSAHLAVIEGRWSEDPVERMRPLPFFQTVVPRRDDPRGGEDYDPAPVYFPELNVGTGYCYSGTSVRGAPGLWADPSDQVRLGPGESLLEEGSSANRVWATVELPHADSVVFNRTWAPEWEASVGRLRRGPLDRMIVDAPPGIHRVELRYAPRTMRFGLALTFIGLVVCAWVMVRRPRRAALSALVFAASTAAALAGYAGAIGPPSGSEQPLAIRARASGYREEGRNDRYAPERAIDGDLSTEWHGRGQHDWLELRPARAVPIASVRILSARNGPSLDRSTTRLRLVARDGVEIVHESESEVPTRFDGGDEWVTIPVGAPRVESLRLTVLDFAGPSGGIAEVELLPIAGVYDAVRGVDASSGVVAAARDRRDGTIWSPTGTDTERWIELSYQLQTRIEGLSLRTADALDVRIELLRGGRRVGVIEHRTAGGASPRWVHVPVHRGGVDRLRASFGDGPVRIAEIRTY